MPGDSSATRHVPALVRRTSRRPADLRVAEEHHARRTPVVDRVGEHVGVHEQAPGLSGTELAELAPGVAQAEGGVCPRRHPSRRGRTRRSSSARRVGVGRKPLKPRRDCRTLKIVSPSLPAARVAGAVHRDLRRAQRRRSSRDPCGRSRRSRRAWRSRRSRGAGPRTRPAPPRRRAGRAGRGSGSRGRGLASSRRTSASSTRRRWSVSASRSRASASRSRATASRSCATSDRSARISSASPPRAAPAPRLATAATVASTSARRGPHPSITRPPPGIAADSHRERAREL